MPIACPPDVHGRELKAVQSDRASGQSALAKQSSAKAEVSFDSQPIAEVRGHSTIVHHGIMARRSRLKRRCAEVPRGALIGGTNVEVGKARRRCLRSAVVDPDVTLESQSRPSHHDAVSIFFASFPKCSRAQKAAISSTAAADSGMSPVPYQGF